MEKNAAESHAAALWYKRLEEAVFALTTNLFAAPLLLKLERSSETSGISFAVKNLMSIGLFMKSRSKNKRCGYSRFATARGGKSGRPIGVETWRGLIFFLCVLALAGCRDTGPANEGQPKATGSDAATYALKGIVVASDAAKGEVSIDAQAIPGFMGAMTMSYKLAQPGIATELHPGDQVMARLRVSSSQSLLDQIDVIAQAKPDYVPARVYNVPKLGQAVPNFKFLNQSGKSIAIDQFRGKVLLVTFIYTRCPLPDYCIRMSRNFATIQKQLAADPGLYNQTHLLSISFDPAYDTPKVLRSYGNLYTGEHGEQAFSHWDFAVPSAAELDTVDEFFDVGVSSGDHNTLTHSLSTAVIAPDGKVFRWYPNNDWTPSAVVDDLKQAAAAQVSGGAGHSR